MLVDINRLQAGIAKVGEKLNRACLFTIEILVNPLEGGVSISEQYGTFWVNGKGEARSEDVFGLLEDVVKNEGDITFNMPH